MPTNIDGTQYLAAADRLKELGITRQTPWRWRREGKIEEVEIVRDCANRIEPIGDLGDAQLSLFNGGNRKEGAR